MKAIMVMFDSLNRDMLQPYGCEWTKTPNFQRLQKKTVMFNNNYAGSLPCIPARRELHTGRYNFLHRSWGPLEPWDDSMPELLKNNGIYSHIVSDHMHYWEDGGATYHTRYNSWEVVRGQEGDKWKVLPELFEANGVVQNYDAKYFKSTNELHRHDTVNRKYLNSEDKMTMASVFKNGLEFIESNNVKDDWFLQIECFDPHEPFYSQQQYKDLYPHDYNGPTYDWPPYHHVTEDEKTAEHLKLEYAALLSMCDHYLGTVLDKMDELNMWEDTMLIVNTDHGYLLGEHEWWSKSIMPTYDEICHIPLFIHDPRLGHEGESRDQLVQTIDLPATLLEFFGLDCPKDMQGKPLRTVIEEDKKIRDYALFGFHGAHINICDGEYVYMKAPENERNNPLHDYTLMPTHMRCRFSVEELKNAVFHEPFSFTKGCKTLKVPCENKFNSEDLSDLIMRDSPDESLRYIDNNNLVNAVNFGNKLFNTKADPKQMEELSDAKVELKMANLLVKAMRENDAPIEQFERIGLPANGDVGAEDIERIYENAKKCYEPMILTQFAWTRSALNTYKALLKFIPNSRKKDSIEYMKQNIPDETEDNIIDHNTILRQSKALIPEKYVDMVTYFISLAGRVS